MTWLWYITDKWLDNKDVVLCIGKTYLENRLLGTLSSTNGDEDGTFESENNNSTDTKFASAFILCYKNFRILKPNIYGLSSNQ